MQLHKRHESSNYYLLITILLLMAVVNFGCKVTDKLIGFVKDNSRRIESKQQEGYLEKKPSLPKILYQGVITLTTNLEKDNPASYINLDNGIVGQSDIENGDIVFRGSKGSMIFYVIAPVNGARKYYGDVDSIDYEFCYENLDLFSSGSVPEFVLGKPICVLTNGGYLAVVKYKLDSFRSYDDGKASIEISFTVWDQDIQKYSLGENN